MDNPLPRHPFRAGHKFIDHYNTTFSVMVDPHRRPHSCVGQGVSGSTFESSDPEKQKKVSAHTRTKREVLPQECTTLFLSSLPPSVDLSPETRLTTGRPDTTDPIK